MALPQDSESNVPNMPGPQGADSTSSGKLTLVLASASPRRRQLLEEAGYAFQVDAARDDLEDSMPPDPEETPLETVARLAWSKAHNVHRRRPADWVLGCDTLADLDGLPIGKPRDRDDAKRILGSLRGRPHYVHTGLCLWPPSPGVPRVATQTTALRLADLSEEEIEAYLDTNMWIGKAGAFGYQDRTGWVTIEAGSESNVVGLPMELLEKMLADAGLTHRVRGV